jgi:hypothetical protein
MIETFTIPSKPGWSSFSLAQQQLREDAAPELEIEKPCNPKPRNGLLLSKCQDSSRQLQDDDCIRSWRSTPPSIPEFGNVSPKNALAGLTLLKLLQLQENSRLSRSPHRKNVNTPGGIPFFSAETKEF